MNTMYDFAFSEQGYNHIKDNKVCQDSSGHYSDEMMSIVVVADGHGSDNYPRTDRGSSFAVESSINAIKEFVTTIHESGIDISQSPETYLEQIAKNILSKWHCEVEADLDKYPFTDEELSKVSEKYKKRYLEGNKNEKAYGTTLIAICQTSDLWFGLQIGDGKCVCISKDGTMFEPIPWDDDCQANITTSICDSDAIEEFRYCVKEECPIATLIGTDGIDDSYASDEELYVLYRSILTIFAEHGREIGEKEVSDFLPGLSKSGSGDDVSIAGIVSSNLSKSFIDVLKAQSEYENAKALVESAKKEIILCNEKQEYILEALKKAKMNLETCEEKASVAQAAIIEAEQKHTHALAEFKQAEDTLSRAIKNHQNDVNSTTEETTPNNESQEDVGAILNEENSSHCEE